MQPLRVLAVISSSKVGGAERAFASMLKATDRARVEVSVVCHGTGPMLQEYRRAASAVWTVDLGRVFDPRAVDRVAAIMRQTHPDLVHTQLWNADVIGGLAARRARIPLLVATVQGGYHQPIGVTGHVRARRAILSRAYRFIYRRFDRIVAVARYVRDDLVRRPGFRVDPGVIDVIPNGLDLDRVNGHGDPGGPPAAIARRGGPRIVSVASLIPMKGHEWLLQALPRVLARYPAARCTLVGDGPRRRELEALARHLEVADRVTFAGWAPDPLALLRESDVFVLPSVAAEGVPLALLEALAVGTPSVATRAGGIPEVLDDGLTGLLVPPGDAPALTEAILRVLGDTALARRLSRAGRDDVGRRFSASATTARLEALYFRLARLKGVR